MWGLANIRDNIDKQFFKQELPQDLQQQIPFVSTLLQKEPMKVQMVILPLLSYPLTKLINNKSLNIFDSISFAKQMMSGLAHLHKFEFGHCDLKPDNLMIDEASKTLVIIDFGCSSKFGKMPQGGNPLHSPPEGVVEVDHGRDIFAAGCIIYTMLSGQHPFGPFTESTWKWTKNEHPYLYPFLKDIYNYNIEQLPFHQDVRSPIPELIKKMLIVGSSQRPTAEQVYSDLVNVKL